MPTLDATPGGPNANSYCTRAEATAYWDAHVQDVNALAFSIATGTDQDRALIQATRLLDQCFIWTGIASGSSQALGWPRKQMQTPQGFDIDPAVIPNQLKNAESQLAGSLLATPSRVGDNDALKFNLMGLKAGDVSLNFDTIGRNSNSLPLRDADVIRQGPDFDYLWKAIPDEARNLIVASWYRRTTVSRPLILQSTR
jgi:hypothetical protein